MNEIDRTEQHLITKNHYLYNYCKDITFKSKNLYNYANYLVRQVFFKDGSWLRYNELNSILKNHESYQELPAWSAQQTLIMLDKNWKSFFKSIKDWSKNKEKYKGRPKVPKYLKKDGHFVCILFANKIRDLFIKLVNTDLTLKTNTIKAKQIRIIPFSSHFTIEIIYNKNSNLVELDKNCYCGIDLGINNFITLTNNLGTQPLVINGKIIKSINQYYNKKVSYYKSILKIKNQLSWSKRLSNITLKRNNKIKDFMHKSSKFLVSYCVKNNIGNIVIGYNKEWKTKVNLSKSTNQNFVSMPYQVFIDQVKYKAEEYGINVILTEESYTSKASFLDFDEMKKNIEFSGERISRGIYKTNKDIIINADVNGSYNIIRKVAPNAFVNGVEDVGLHPLRINIS